VRPWSWQLTNPVRASTWQRVLPSPASVAWLCSCPPGHVHDETGGNHEGLEKADGDREAGSHAEWIDKTRARKEVILALYQVNTKLSPEQAVQRAKAYFAANLGLEVTEESPCCISFVGGGGHVTVTARTGQKRNQVELETREWDYHVQQFMHEIA
jgi:hypothetical protein